MTTPPPVEDQARRRPALTALLFLAAVLFSLVAAETVARLYLYQSLRMPPYTHFTQMLVAHPTRGWTGRPSATTGLKTLEYVTTTRTNSLGMNDREYAVEKPEGVFRIVMVGDSFLFGREVGRGQGLPALLEAALAPRQVEVINLGVIGYGTTQAYFMLVEEGLQFQPDLVVLQLFPFNDVRDNSHALNAEMWGEDIAMTWGRPYGKWREDKQTLVYRKPPWDRLIHAFEDLEGNSSAPPWVQSALVALGTHALNRTQESLQGPAFDPETVLLPYLKLPPSQAERIRAWDEALKVTTKQVLEMASAAEAASARFAVFSVPSRIQVDPEYRASVAQMYPELEWDLAGPEQSIRERCEEQGIPFLDLRQTFAEAYESGCGPYYFQIQDPHWNAAGHRLAAERLLPFLEPFLPGE